MKQIIRQREFCNKCNHMIHDEEWSEECNQCKKEIKWDKSNGFPFSLSFVGKYDNPKGETEDANFCSFSCFVKWLKQEKYLAWDTKNHFFSLYLHKQELDSLKSYIRDEM